MNRYRLIHQNALQHFVLILSLLLSFQPAYATRNTHKKAAKQKPAITQPLLTDPTNTLEVIRIFGSLPSPQFIALACFRAAATHTH